MTSHSGWLRKRANTSSGGGYAPIEQPLRYSGNVTSTQLEEVEEAPLDYEYCFEIAGGEQTFQHHVGCTFAIKKTQAEKRLSKWEKIENERVVRYRILTSVDEPKQMVVTSAERSMGITPLAPTSSA